MDTATEVFRPRAFHPEDAPRLGTGTERPGWDFGTERRIDDGEALAAGIGWFSIALGLAELAAPRRFTGSLGMESQERLVQLYGLREIAKGAGILRQRRPVGWLRARIAGDVLDLATLAAALRRDNPKRANVRLAMAAVAGVAFLDVLCALQLERSRHRADALRSRRGEEG